VLRAARAIVDGQTIAYATEGVGYPLLLLHGLGFDQRAWALVAPFLAGHFRLIIPDMPGIGSSRAASWARWEETPEAMVRLYGGFLTATQAVPAYLAGAGFGGVLALALAARFPERVLGVVVVGGLGLELWPTNRQSTTLRSLVSMPWLLDLLAQTTPHRHARQFLRDSFASGEPPDELVTVVAGVLQDPISRQALIRTIIRLDRWKPLLRGLGGVRAPTLLVWGERDRVVGLPEAERLRHAIPAAQIMTLPDAGHALTIERPADVAAIIRKFGQRA
jgi:pimeloyl-ACP methyl ester carboxylesterase